MQQQEYLPLPHLDDTLTARLKIVQARRAHEAIICRGASIRAGRRRCHLAPPCGIPVDEASIHPIRRKTSGYCLKSGRNDTARTSPPAPPHEGGEHTAMLSQRSLNTTTLLRLASPFPRRGTKG